MPQLCSSRCGKKAVLKRPKTGDALCKECFYWAFETEIHFTIVRSNLFETGDYVAIGASGGKDSTVLAYVLKTLNERYNYGLKLVLLSIDEGITGYRDDSLETVKRNRDQYGIPLKILSYEELYGWTMDKIVEKVGRKNNCTFCGVFRRQALDRGAMILGVNKICTGHNADDIAETVVMNVLRGDVARLQRCTAAITGGNTEGIKRAITSCVKYIYNQQIISSTKQYLLKGKTILNPKQSNQNLYCNGVPYRSKFIQFTWSLTFIGSAVFIFQRYVVCIWNLEGESNVPTFEDGDIVLTTTFINELKRGDFVIFKSPFDCTVKACKRVIGLPGDVIPAEAIENLPYDDWSHYGGKVPRGKMWIEGDNEWDSTKFKDSRSYGSVPIGLIEGVVFCRLWPRFMRRKSWINDLSPCDT